MSVAIKAINKFLNALFSGVSLMTWPQQLSLTGMEITSTSRKTGSYQEVAHHSKGMKLTFKA